MLGKVNGPMRAYTSFGTPLVLHHLRALVETAGLALHDEEPERISRLFDETIADFSIGSDRRRACGKYRQRSLKPPSKRHRRAEEIDRRVPLLLVSFSPRACEEHSHAVRGP